VGWRLLVLYLSGMEAVHRLYQLVYSFTSRNPLVDDGLERIRDKVDVEVGEFFLLGNDSEHIAGTVFLISFLQQL
jgi:hypothetical protein